MFNYWLVVKERATWCNMLERIHWHIVLQGVSRSLVVCPRQGLCSVQMLEIFFHRQATAGSERSCLSSWLASCAGISSKCLFHECCSILGPHWANGRLCTIYSVQKRLGLHKCGCFEQEDMGRKAVRHSKTWGVGRFHPIKLMPQLWWFIVSNMVSGILILVRRKWTFKLESEELYGKRSRCFFGRCGFMPCGPGVYFWRSSVSFF